MTNDPLHERLDALAQAPRDQRAWKPLRFELASATDRKRLEALLNDGAVHRVHDTVREQLADLLDTRIPERKVARAELMQLVAAHLGSTPAHAYGTWVYYPWSQRLVHVLPEAEYRELRTSRNRNKITTDEQQRLQALRVGVAGLSVGQATAVTLALEEVGGSFFLADFDWLELSNMNRLRSGVQNLGVNKAILTAREIYEFNPYADVTVFTDGVTEENLDVFLGGDTPLDLLFEECDDLYIKVRLRERARARRIPVIMETSDRGLIDVERFDREPERPILHGLIGDYEASALKGLTTYEKVPIVLRLIGSTTVSERMAASLVDIETTLKTWPQLASAVALGGALNTDAARRIALGQFCRSGRFFVDLEQLVSDAADGDVVGAGDDRGHDTSVAELEPEVALPKGAERTRLDDETIRAIVAYGAMAPSGGNCQPWRFRFEDGLLCCFHDIERSRSFLDFEHEASHMIFGCVAFNIELAARSVGIDPATSVFPDPADPTLVCKIDLRRAATPVHDPLLDWIPRRGTNRKLGKRVSLPADHIEQLGGACRELGGELHLVHEAGPLRALRDLLAEGDRLRFLHEVMHREMMHEIRWSSESAQATRDGIDVATLELTATDLAGMKLISKWGVMDVLGRMGAGRGLEKPTRKAIDASAAVGLVSFQGRGPADFLAGGRALQRVWLHANALGYAFQPMTAILYLFSRLEHGDGEGLNPRQRETLTDLRRRYLAVFGDLTGRAEIMLFRLARADPPSARALRRDLDEILTIVR